MISRLKRPFNWIPLSASGKTEITEIVLRKPQSGAARYTPAGHYGYGCERDDYRDPRISSPALTAQEIAEMDRQIHCHVGWLSLFFVEEVGACRFTDSLMVDDLVADIATIFHWPPSVTDAMPLTEVPEWRYKAIQRSGPTMSDNNLRLQVILNAVDKLTRPFQLHRPVRKSWLAQSETPVTH